MLFRMAFHFLRYLGGFNVARYFFGVIHIYSVEAGWMLPITLVSLRGPALTVRRGTKSGVNDSLENFLLKTKPNFELNTNVQ